jgi:hypothetical protein
MLLGYISMYPSNMVAQPILSRKRMITHFLGTSILKKLAPISELHCMCAIIVSPELSLPTKRLAVTALH